MPPVVESTTTIGSYGTGSRNVAKPSGLQVGELLVAYIYTAGQNNAVTTPAGWTQVFAQGVGSYPCREEMHWKIADAGDVAASQFAFSCSDAFNVFLMRVSNFNPVTPFNATVGVTTGTYGTKTIPWAATPAFEAHLILITGTHRRENGSASGYAVANNNPALWTEGFDYSALTGSHHLMGALGYAQRINAASPGNATIVINNGGYSGNGIYHAVMINPAPPEGPPEVDTYEATFVTQETATFQGEMIDKNLENASLAGFVFGTTSQSLPDETTAPGDTGYEQYVEQAGDFDNTDTWLELVRTLEAGTTYYMRAYAYNDDGYGYGDEVTFETLTIKPTILSVEPEGVLIDTEQNITITGSQFAEGCTVEIDGEACTNIVVVNSTTITCDIPTSSIPKDAVLIVTNPDDKSASIGFFYIEGVSPTPQPGSVSATFSVKGVGYMG